MAGSRALFLGFGVSSYDHDPEDRLPAAETDVLALGRLLRADFDTETLIDPTEQVVRSRGLGLQDHFDTGGFLLVFWSGHGEPADVGGLKLYARDTSPRAVMAGIRVTDLAGYVATSRATQILLVIDACYSDAGSARAEAAAEAIVAARPPDDDVWIGVLAACGAGERAYDGELGGRVLQLLQDGPADPDMKAEWTRHNRLIRGDQFALALRRDWSSRRQQVPRWRMTGYPERMLPNPLFNDLEPPAIVAHLLAAARGGAVTDDRVWFTGRHRPMTRLTAWVTDRRPGLYLVTGSPGTGKSALLGRVVSLSVRGERARVLRDQPGIPAGEDPGLGSVAANVNVRRLTPDGVAERLGDSLARAGLLPQPPGDAGRLLDLVAAAGWAAGSAPVVVVDGVDEARGEAFDIVRDLLVPLSEHVVVLASSRPGREAGTGASLLRELRPADTIDLDAPDLLASGLADMHDYIEARLQGKDAAMDPSQIARLFTATRSPFGAQLTDRPFLLARLVTDQLLDRPVDTSRPDWWDQVAPTIQEAFEKDLLASVAPAPGQPTTVRDVRVARAAMAALPWGSGSGLPDEEWRLVANALAPRIAGGAGPSLSREDLGTVLDRLGRYVIQDGDAGQAVYRVFHQSLADHLRPPFRATSRQLFPPLADAVADALLGRTERLAARGVLATASPYLTRYAVRHAELAGPDRLHRLSMVLDRVGTPLEGVGDALRRVAALAAEHDRLDVLDQVAALPWPAELSEVADDAVARARWVAGAGAAEPPFGSPDPHREGRQPEPTEPSTVDLESAFDLHVSSAPDERDPGGADWAAAIGAVRAAVDDVESGLATRRPGRLMDERVPDAMLVLAAAMERLATVANPQAELSVDQLDRAVAVSRQVATMLPVARGSAAGVLSAAGSTARLLGLTSLAVAWLEEAVTTYRALPGGTAHPAAGLPHHRSAFVRVLVELSEALAQAGEVARALPPAEQAAAQAGQLGGGEVALRDTMAAFSTLGVRLAALGRQDESLAPTRAAVQAGRRLVAEHGARHRTALALAMNNLGNRLREAGRLDEALDAAAEAVDELGRQADDLDVQQTLQLATAELNESQLLAQAGRAEQAYHAAAAARVRLDRLSGAEAVPLRAAVCTTLGARLSDLGRIDEALEASHEAAWLYRRLTADDPAYLADSAAAESNLANRFLAAGRAREAVQPARHAVQVYRQLAADNPGFLAAFAESLRNLSEVHAATGDIASALAAAKESAQVYRSYFRDSDPHAFEHAQTVRVLARRLRESGDSAGADAAEEEAELVLAEARDRRAERRELAARLYPAESR